MVGRIGTQWQIAFALASSASFLSVTTEVIVADDSPTAGPAEYRTGTPDSRVGQVPTELTEGVFSDPEQFLSPLVRALTDSARDDFHKVKILHDWIAENIAYDVESYFSDSQTADSADTALTQRRAVCHGYASIFSQMCAVLNIPCADISGHGRGYGFLSGRSLDVSEENHAWNAVRIDGQWYLVDVTWDAGYVEGREFRKEYRTTYLFMEPRYFVFTHLPTEPRWQLLRTAVTNDQFRQLPHLLGPFFDHGMRLLTRLTRVTPAGESIQFSVYVPPGSELMAKLTAPDGAKQPQRTLVQQTVDRCKVFVIFPEVGAWTVQLFARHHGSDDQFSLAAELDFDSAAGASDRFFPKTFNAYGNLRGCLISPLYLPLPPEKPLLFKVRLPGARNVSLAIGDAPWLRFQPNPDDEDVYQIETSLPAGEYVRLNARTNPAEKQYDTVIGFDVPDSD